MTPITQKWQIPFRRRFRVVPERIAASPTVFDAAVVKRCNIVFQKLHAKLKRKHLSGPLAWKEDSTHKRKFGDFVSTKSKAISFKESKVTELMQSSTRVYDSVDTSTEGPMSDPSLFVKLVCVRGRDLFITSGFVSTPSKYWEKLPGPQLLRPLFTVPFRLLLHLDLLWDSL
ncbi:hypothetical protein O6P43_032217 [Quillaja saponaria]|uniref:Uncharacterized protein n=1 Tax=Quillaja saponaria TaxID=32244 RepID=A0AAD7KWT6_QUISA|nr:hypothetical protein O6P43_032217 [Quillaja saponaria]